MSFFELSGRVGEGVAKIDESKHKITMSLEDMRKYEHKTESYMYSCNASRYPKLIYHWTLREKL